MAEPELLRTNEACAYLKIGRSKLFQLARRGVIRRTRIGGCVRWKRQELERLIDRCSRPER